METLIVKIGGMTCGGCAGGVEKALAAVPGVQAVTADHVAGQASVSGAELTARLAELRTAVENAGFDWLD